VREGTVSFRSLLRYVFRENSGGRHNYTAITANEKFWRRHRHKVGGVIAKEDMSGGVHLKARAVFEILGAVNGRHGKRIARMRTHVRNGPRHVTRWRGGGGG
jgi:hypothetical protein